MNQSIFKMLVGFGVCAALAACQTSQTLPKDAPRTVKLGKPYSVAGKTYYPSYDPDYSETGVASWYGPGFHGKKTANGETYDQHDLTAAHKTLPMPSLVKVTNLDNGKEVTVRITDRGPFKSGRIIDLSQAAAESLNIKGLGNVRVDYLKAETEQLWAGMNLRPQDIAFAKNDRKKPSNDEIQQADNAYDARYNDIEIDPSQISASAPIMSVSSVNVGDVAPVAPQPRKASGFGLISSAEASTLPPDTPFGPPSTPLDDTPQRENDNQAIGRLLSDDEHLENPVSAGHGRNAKALPRALDPPIPKGGGFVVQAGAFTSRENAELLAKKLQVVGAVSVDSVTRNNTRMHRVRIGPYASKTEAEQRLHDLFVVGIKDAQVVSYD